MGEDKPPAAVPAGGGRAGAPPGCPRRGEGYRRGGPVGELGYVEAAGELDAISRAGPRAWSMSTCSRRRLCRAVEIVEELGRRIRGARQG